jgi:FeS assembly SUF system protein
MRNDGLTLRDFMPGAPNPGDDVAARAGVPLPVGSKVADRDALIAALRTVHDPEIPVNIYDLGLIYAIDSRQDGSVKVEMTLTAPGCPVAEEIPIWVRDAVAKVETTTDIQVEIVWDPPWDPSMMSDYAKIELGMY